LFLKQLSRPFIPKTSIWTSHTITILFAALAAAVVTFAVLKKVEAALHESEERYGLLFDSSIVLRHDYEK
jgi:hypothetical protein